MADFRAAAELTAIAVTGLAEASRRVAARPLIIVADVARLAEVESLLSAAQDLPAASWAAGPGPPARRGDLAGTKRPARLARAARGAGAGRRG